MGLLSDTIFLATKVMHHSLTTTETTSLAVPDQQFAWFMNNSITQTLNTVARALRLYHRHKVIGMKHVPRKGPVIVACSHSLATYDISLVMSAIYDQIGRFPRSLIDHAFYKVPYLGELMEKFGCVNGTQENARHLLKDGEMIYLAPGGMNEALRPSTDKYKILWDRRRGFARLSFETGAPIILAACPAADDIYEVYENPVTNWVYKNFRFPVFLARGVATTPIPRPVKLVHVLSEPIYPPKPLEDEAARKRQLDRYHKKLVKRMTELMEQARES